MNKLEFYVSDFFDRISSRSTRHVDDYNITQNTTDITGVTARRRKLLNDKLHYSYVEFDISKRRGRVGKRAKAVRAGFSAAVCGTWLRAAAAFERFSFFFFFGRDGIFRATVVGRRVSLGGHGKHDVYTYAGTCARITTAAAVEKPRCRPAAG